MDASWGYRAAFITLRNYFLRHSLKTLRGWINRWAPPVENDTENYVRFVAGKSAVDADAELCITDASLMQRIVSAMSWMENGVPAKAQDVKKGWQLAFG